jgi:hypothetical protein
VKRYWQISSVNLVLIAGLSLLTGITVRSLLPPFVVDKGFWFEFLTGPPIGGAFAVVAAVVAYIAATRAASVARRAAERQSWWDRAEWALNLVVSDRSADRDAGLLACEELLADATEIEGGIIVAVTSVYLPAGDVDNTQPGDGDLTKKKGWPWSTFQKIVPRVRAE